MTEAGRAEGLNGPRRAAWLRGQAAAIRLRGLTVAVRARGLAVAVIVGMLAAASAAPALADTGDIVEAQHTPPTAGDGWQAGTCKKEPPEISEPCSIKTPNQYFEQAAGHPQFGFTQIIVKHGAPGETPVGELKTVRVDLPVGLSVNPQATEQCTQQEFEANPALECPGAAVGKSIVTASVPPLGLPAPPLEPVVYNIVPANGEPARFGFNLAGNDVYLRADVAWQSDYHEGFTIDVPATPFNKLPLSEGLFGGVVLENRLVFNGRAGNGTFVTTPTTCLGESLPTSPYEHAYSTWLRADGYGAGKEDPNFPNGSSPFESRIPSKLDFGAEPGTFPKECDTIPFAPSLEVEPGTAETDSPAGAAVMVEVPFEEPEPSELTHELTKQASSLLKDASVTMPAGMGLNPSAASDRVACTDEQFGKGTRNPVECPAASKIGTVSVQTPPLPPDSLEGNVYLGQQLSRNPASGDEYRIFVDVESARYGISARLIGHVAADPQSGRLTATFADNPQVPFESFRLQFDGGPRAPLTSPAVCGPHETTSQMTPWSSTPGSIPAGEPGGPSSAPPETPSGEFSLTSAPGGGACAKTLAERPFKPGFGAQTVDPQAGAFSELRLTMTRADGEQELKGTTVNLPPGVTAKLAGVAYCPEAAIAAAAANSGVAEAAHPSCPASSLIGAASVLSGTGSEPLQIAGKAFLAGPYHGAPLSLAIVTPATAGPFDLGSVVVRVALFVDPETAQVRAVSDPIPHVFGGALLDIRSITVNMNRPRFSLNPTSCAPKTVSGTIEGGGANPADPAAFSSAAVSAPFQVSGCEKLGFAPTLSLRLSGGMRRAKHPALRAVFTTRPGDANPARVAVTLPHFLFLDQANLAKVCTRVQFAEGSTPGERCPADSVYGYARASTPLLDRPLEGPVYLRSSSNLLPDLVAALHGQVNVVLDGRTDSVNGRIRNSFEAIPDVPVSKFELTMPGGRHGLLVNSESICPRRGRGPSLGARADMTGQNGKTANQRFKLGVPCRRRHHRHRHHKHHHH